ncbi:MAG TPA: COX15/CtaA family protein [Streptosporangiaceae bacterium]|nr:COX15/CtaA family protein [Streptosporangiaceae bacterium]
MQTPLAAWRSWLGPLADPSPATMRRLALAGVVANAGIMVTGAAVRLSNSGLGCANWPDCTRSSLVAAPRAGEPVFHTWIEFGNRTLTGVVELVAVLVLVAAWRYRPPGTSQRRNDLVWLAALQPIGVVLQAVVGGIVVLTELDPVWVSVHFLLSTAVVAAAVTLYVRCTEATGPAAPLLVRLVGSVVLAAVFVMLAAGTVVTGTGPLAGAPGVPRYPLHLPAVTQVHSDIGWLLGGLTLVFVLVLRFGGASRRAVRLGYVFIGLLGIQGVLGYVQYFTHLPAGVVWVHESLAVVIWVTMLLLWFALWERGTARSQPGTETAQETATALGPIGSHP